MANPELCLSEFQNTIPTFVPAVLHTFSDYQKWYRFRTPIQNFEIFGIGILLFGFPIRLAPEFYNIPRIENSADARTQCHNIIFNNIFRGGELKDI